MAEAFAPVLSVTCGENVNVPVLVGVPLMLPAGLSVRPGGRPPELIDHEYGEDPPKAARF
jgi:hypothetical protein